MAIAFAKHPLVRFQDTSFLTFELALRCITFREMDFTLASADSKFLYFSIVVGRKHTVDKFIKSSFSLYVTPPYAAPKDFASGTRDVVLTPVVSRIHS